MGEPCSWPTAIAPIGPVALGSVRWSNRGQRHLSIVVKARFALRHEAPMVITGPSPLVERDEHRDGDPTKSLAAASDVVPYRSRADVWLTGHAHGPQDRAVLATVVRLALYRGGHALVDKTIHVVGTRKVAGASPEAFRRMPLVYERAFGGVGFDDNPVGVGADERQLFPNLVHPQVLERPAGFGPISRYWKARRGELDASARRAVAQAEPDLPDAFDFDYFQAAPVDQRVPYLHGDEWLVLEGMHPTLLRVHSRIPRARAVARWIVGDEPGDAIALVADALAIDADAQTCSITWRGSVRVDRDDLGDVVVAGGVDIDGRGVDWSQARVTWIAPPRAVVPIVLDRSGVTLVSGRPDGAEDLGSTSVDSHRVGATNEAGVPVGGSAYRRVAIEAEWAPGDAWPSYPLGGDEEVTETKTAVPVREPSERGRRMTLPVDTIRDDPSLGDDESWVNEPVYEPTVTLRSVPPAPFDVDAYVLSLRRAGASEADIQALLGLLPNGATRRDE
jgi:hypothetical protein